MYKVMIVDDEPIVRLGMKSSINWKDGRLLFAGEYSNGLEALQAMIESPVDILFTDIKMPVMDGLELTKKVKQAWPETKVVLISSYNDFDYVRQGILLGAVDYMQKSTIETEEVASVINRSIELIEKERHINRSLDEYLQNVHESRRKRAEHDLKKILSQGLDDDLYNKSLPGCYENGYVMILSVIDGVKDIREGNGGLYVSMLLDELQDYFHSLHLQGMSIATHDESEILFILPRQADAASDIAKLKERLEKKADLHLTIGYLEEPKLKNWSVHYLELRDTYERRFFDGGHGVYEYKNGRPVRSNPPEIQMDSLPWEEQAGKSAEVYRLVGQSMNKWRQEGADASRMKKEACELFSSLSGNRIEQSLSFEYCYQLMNSETIQELNANLLSYVQECELQTNSGNHNTNTTNDLINQAVQFIHKHYTEEITLQMVADHVHISRSYFSLLYKKHTHLNFIDYVIQLRIEKAKELLRGDTIKIYEVARASGFNDVKYFSKLFKKMTGFSPFYYRAHFLGTNSGESD